MSLFFSRATGQGISTPVNPLTYQDVISSDLRSAAEPSEDAEERVDACETETTVSSQELESLLANARAEANTEAQRKLGLEMEERLAKEAALVRDALDAFDAERKRYFARVEVEVIQLSLAVAAKVLHREARADPMVIAAMIRIALDKLQDSSSVSIRVPSAEVERWREYTAQLKQRMPIEIVGEAQPGWAGCILQTSLGTVDFSMDAQLKEVEQGFFDLLAQRPGVA